MCAREKSHEEMWSIKKEQSLKGTGDKTRIKILLGLTSVLTFQQFMITHCMYILEAKLKIGI